ncbi:SRPBCC family protein [Streptomyces sp. NPDC088762]|uniref:SRPBCC family protein n=1 Tax=Streptomyces sp. NPDC088762 TaxID=3365891 RepID=UPI003821EB4A
MIDVTGQISAVRREVGNRVLEAGEARVVSLSRSYPAELADVWDACTNPERIPRWFLPVTGELKEGGRYQLQDNAGGTVTRCDPPHGFDATWEVGDDTTWVELRLTDEGDGRTLFRLTHIGHVDDERWARFGPGAVGVGWDSSLTGLHLHLSSGRAVDPAEWDEWSATDEGRRYLTASSDGWYEASVAFGTDPAEARAAADRTTAFYTGEPEPGAGDIPHD